MKQTWQWLWIVSRWTTKRRNSNTLTPRWNGQHFADDILKHIFFNENVWISIHMSLKRVPKGSFDSITALFQVMSWCGQATSHYRNQWWPVYRRIYASLGPNELSYMWLILPGASAYLYEFKIDVNLFYMIVSISAYARLIPLKPYWNVWSTVLHLSKSRIYAAYPCVQFSFDGFYWYRRAHPGSKNVLLSLGPRDANVCLLTGSSLLQLMGCCLCSTKPLTEPLLICHQLDRWE